MKLKKRMNEWLLLHFYGDIHLRYESALGAYTCVLKMRTHTQQNPNTILEFYGRGLTAQKALKRAFTAYDEWEAKGRIHE